MKLPIFVLHLSISQFRGIRDFVGALDDLKVEEKAGTS